MQEAPGMACCSLTSQQCCEELLAQFTSNVTLPQQLPCMSIAFLLVVADIALPLLYMIPYIYICRIYYIELLIGKVKKLDVIQVFLKPFLRNDIILFY